MKVKPIQGMLKGVNLYLETTRMQLNSIASYCFTQLHPCIALYINLLPWLVQLCN